MPTTKTRGIIALLLIIAALALAGTMDAKDADNSQKMYCEMVALWDKDTARGIAPEKRTGWPPYDGRKQCKTEE